MKINVTKLSIITIISLFTLAVIGLSYAYFSTEITGEGKYVTLDTANLKLKYTDNTVLSLDNAIPGDFVTKTFTVENIGTKKVSYNIVWNNLINTINNYDLHLDMKCKSYKNYNTTNQVEEGKCDSFYKAVPYTETSINKDIKRNNEIDIGITHEYTVTITFKNRPYLQNDNLNKSFSGKIDLEEYVDNSVYCTFDGTLTQGAEYVNGQYTYRYKQEGDFALSGLAWHNITSDGWGVQLTDKTSTDAVTSKACTYINNKPIVSMVYMFSDSQATTLDLSNFDTSNVTNIGGMFYRIQTPTLDVSKFNTSNVTNMNSMFDSSQVTTLDLSNFDTSKVTAMAYMFDSATNLKTIYVSNKFNTNNVNYSTYMFNNCTKLVGGSGTKYNSSYTDKTYARIDGGTSSPGYFTDIADKPSEPNSFATDSWKTIVKAVRSNNISKYRVGDTKTVDMGTYGTHTLRIANTSTPSECSTSGFSQSACGFVLEFADIITTHNINPSGTYDGWQYDHGWSKDGWPASSMYTFVNTNIYNALPSDLKSGIINTRTISGYGTENNNNFTSIDKLYLLAPIEIYANSVIDYDTASDLTRTLDYYLEKDVSIAYSSEAIKKNGTSAAEWWLRTAYNKLDGLFFAVDDKGQKMHDMVIYNYGVSPAFRIG